VPERDRRLILLYSIYLRMLSVLRKKSLACSQQPSTCQHVPVRTSSFYFFLSHFSVALTSTQVSQETSTIFSWKMFYAFWYLTKFLSAWTNWSGSVLNVSCCVTRCCVSTVQLVVALHWLNDRVAVQSKVGTNKILRPAQVICKIWLGSRIG